MPLNRNYLQASTLTYSKGLTFLAKILVSLPALQHHMGQSIQEWIK